MEPTTLQEYVNIFNSFFTGPIGVALIAGITSWFVSRKRTERTKSLLSLQELIKQIDSQDSQGKELKEKNEQRTNLEEAINQLILLELIGEIEKYTIPRRSISNRVILFLLVGLTTIMYLLFGLTSLITISNPTDSSKWVGLAVAFGLLGACIILLALFSNRTIGPEDRKIDKQRAQLYKSPKEAVTNVFNKIISGQDSP